MQLRIVVLRRSADWTATAPDLTGAWEVGSNEAEAIGNLIITLHRCWPERGVSIDGDPVKPTIQGGPSES